jgi:GntR family transcriptional regulator
MDLAGVVAVRGGILRHRNMARRLLRVSKISLTPTRYSDIYHSNMQLFVNPSDELPLYRQIMRQIMEAIAGGRLKGGEKLASHRDLSEQLVIAPLTVKKAYDELEALGFIETQRGRGTFVCARRPHTDRSVQLEHIQQASRKLLSQAYLVGLSFGEVVKALEEADREVTQGPQPQSAREPR